MNILCANKSIPHHTKDYLLSNFSFFLNEKSRSINNAWKNHIQRETLENLKRVK